MKMPLATFEGAIRVGQEKAVIAEEITLTFGIVDAANAPVSINGSSAHAGSVGSSAGVAPAATVPPLRVAMNATG
jgi:3-hydroxyacyl-[acyl-carrier-protein] dehydratase